MFDRRECRWQDSVHLGDEMLLAHLRQQQLLGRIRLTAQALVLFDQGWRNDVPSWPALRDLTTWKRHIQYDELHLCKDVLRLNKGMCDARARGRFILAKIPIASYSKTLQQAWETQPLKGKGMARLLTTGK